MVQHVGPVESGRGPMRDHDAGKVIDAEIGAAIVSSRMDQLDQPLFGLRFRGLTAIESVFDDADLAVQNPGRGLQLLFAVRQHGVLQSTKRKGRHGEHGQDTKGHDRLHFHLDAMHPFPRFHYFPLCRSTRPQAKANPVFDCKSGRSPENRTIQP